MTSLAGAIELDDVGEEPDFVPDSVVAERYRVLGVLGVGGMGKVYLAEHLEVGRKVAIKVLLAKWSAHASIVRRFRAEARTAGAIGHPNIVQVFDAGSLPDGRLFLVMEHLDGRDLADELAAVRVFAPERACVLIRQIALALGAGHRAGIVHRDMKPSNVMLVPQPDGEAAKVLDFGIAVNPTIGGPGDRLTDPGSLVGTPEYLAPEQATGAPPGPSFDVYAVGVMLFEMLTGELPLDAEHGFELLSLKVHRPAPRVAGRRSGLPDALAQLVDDCLEIDPRARPADGDALVARIDAVLADMRREPETIAPVETETPPPASPRVTAPPPRGRAPVLGVAFAGAAVVGALALAMMRAPAAAPGEAAQARSAETRSAPPAEPTEPRAEPPRLEPVAPPEEPPPAVEAAPVTDAPKDMAKKLAATRPPRAGGDEHLTPRCARVRTTAEEARRSQRWSVLRDSSRQRECWASSTEARKLQTKALMELGDFSGCLSVGKGLKDQEVQAWLKLCQKRAGG